MADGPFAVVIGEALVDMLEVASTPHRLYREAVGGAPLNVATGIARLGAAAHLVGTVGDDALARRIRAFLAEAGVGTDRLVKVSGPTTIALATFEGAEPDFRFYGSPPSYGLLTPSDVDARWLAKAAAVYGGSIALLCPPVLAAVRRAWAVPGPLKVLDPNVRPSLVTDRRWLREVIEELAGTADLVKLSAADADVLYGAAPAEAAQLLTRAGAAAVVVTQGSGPVHVQVKGETATVPPRAVEAVDTTGGGDAVMAGLMYKLVTEGRPGDLSGWVGLAEFATAVAAVVVTRPGGAIAMPTREQVVA